MTLEENFNNQINQGYINPDGKPIKCTCNSKDFIRTNQIYEEGYLVEYSLQCNNKICQKILGYWSYGYWEI